MPRQRRTIVPETIDRTLGMSPTLIYRWEDPPGEGHPALDIWAYRTDDDILVWLQQGDDRISIPWEDYGRVVDALEALYAS